jgi:hypothetical protein
MPPRGIKDSGARPPRSPGPHPWGNRPGGRWVQADTARDEVGDGRGAAEQGGGRDPWRLPSEDLLLALGIRRHGCSGNGLVLVRCRKHVSVPCSALAVPSASRTGVHLAAARPVLPAVVFQPAARPVLSCRCAGRRPSAGSASGTTGGANGVLHTYRLLLLAWHIPRPPPITRPSRPSAALTPWYKKTKKTKSRLVTWTGRP